MHTSGRSGRPNSAQLRSGVRWMHGTPAGLPSGIPGIGDEIEMTIQQAAQPIRHSMAHLRFRSLTISLITIRYYSKAALSITLAAARRPGVYLRWQILQ